MVINQSRHLDVTVGKVEMAGKPSRRFAPVPNGAESAVAALCQVLQEQGWRPVLAVTVISDGEAVLPGLVRAAAGGPVAYILVWWHISMRVHYIE